MTDFIPLTQAEKDRDAHDGYFEAIRAIRLQKIRSGELQSLSDEEARDAKGNTV